MGDADKQRRYRDRRRGGPVRVPQPHGTRAAIRRHERAGEPVCELCRLERNRIAREYYHQAAGSSVLWHDVTEFFVDGTVTRND